MAETTCGYRLIMNDSTLRLLHARRRSEEGSGNIQFGDSRYGLKSYNKMVGDDEIRQAMHNGDSSLIDHCSSAPGKASPDIEYSSWGKAGSYEGVVQDLNWTIQRLVRASVRHDWMQENVTSYEAERSRKLIWLDSTHSSQHFHFE